MSAAETCLFFNKKRLTFIKCCSFRGIKQPGWRTKPRTDTSSLQSPVSEENSILFFVSKNDLHSSKTCASPGERGGERGSGALWPGRWKQSERRARGGYRVGEGFSSSWGVPPLSCRVVRRGRPVILGPHQDDGDGRTTEETRTAHDGADAPQANADGGPAQRSPSS